MREYFPFQIRMKSGEDYIDGVYHHDPMIDWCCDELDSPPRSYNIIPIDGSGVTTRDNLFLFKEEKDFIMFCLKFGHMRSER